MCGSLHTFKKSEPEWNSELFASIFQFIECITIMKITYLIIFNMIYEISAFWEPILHKHPNKQTTILKTFVYETHETLNYVEWNKFYIYNAIHYKHVSWKEKILRVDM